MGCDSQWSTFINTCHYWTPSFLHITNKTLSFLSLNRVKYLNKYQADKKPAFYISVSHHSVYKCRASPWHSRLLSASIAMWEWDKDALVAPALIHNWKTLWLLQYHPRIQNLRWPIVCRKKLFKNISWMMTLVEQDLYTKEEIVCCGLWHLKFWVIDMRLSYRSMTWVRFVLVLGLGLRLLCSVSNIFALMSRGQSPTTTKAHALARDPILMQTLNHNPWPYWLTGWRRPWYSFSYLFGEAKGHYDRD